MGAIDKIEHNLAKAITDADLLVVNLSYEEVESFYRENARDLRLGVVILDMSPLKSPSLQWAEQYLSDEHYLVGMTPIVNPRYLFRPQQNIEEAEEDMFDDSSILLTPAASCAKEAVDLAFSFVSVLGSNPRFLDPLEHDTLLSQTVQLPRLLGTILFYDLMKQDSWSDLKWFTNPDFGVLTRPLFDNHPDALRDEFFNNREVLARGLDGLINSLQQYRDALQTADRGTIETVIVDAAKEYEAWINSRYRADWDADTRAVTPKGSSLMQNLLGGALADKLSGKDNDDD
jgi:prephenate dehydrogenase